MSAITTHVLDLHAGKPAKDVVVRLDVHRAGQWVEVGKKKTDADGRAKELVASGGLQAARYRLTFGVGDYFAARNVTTFWGEIPIEFEIRDASQHYHVPLLLSPFGYSTYRGS